MARRMIDYGDLPENELNKKAEATVRFAENLIRYAIEGKEKAGVMERYNKSIEYYNGKHKIKERDEKKGNQVWNKYAQTFDHRISEITDASLKWKFDPIEESDILTSYPLDKVLGDVVLERTGWNDGKGEEAIIECAHAGSVHIKTLADTETGMANFVVIPTMSAFPDPAAKSKNQLRFFIHMIAKNVKEIERDYGVKVNPEYNLIDIESKSKKAFQYSFEVESSSNMKMPSEIIGKGDNDIQIQNLVDEKMGMAVLAEIWLEDKELVKIPFDPKEIEEEHTLFSQGMYKAVDAEENHLMHVKAHKVYLETINPIVNEEQYKLLQEHIDAHLQYEITEYRQKYKNGRIITVCQGKLLRDEPNPLPIHWRDVFIKIDWIKVPGQYWGKQLGHDIYDPQDALNHRKNAITKNINNLNNGIYKIKINVFEKLFGRGNKKKMTNLDGHAIPVYDLNDVSRDFGPAMPPHVFQDMIHTENHINETQAMQGVMVGMYPKGSPPDSTVQRLLEQGQKPLRSVLKHYSSALKQMAINAIKIMYEFMPDEMYFRVVGEDKKAKMIKWGDLKNGGIYDIKITIEPTLATTRQMQFNKALALREANVYDDIAVLNAIDDPQKYEVIQRKDMVAQLQATVQQLIMELDKKEKEKNTILNRLQGKIGEGNVGETKTSE